MVQLLVHHKWFIRAILATFWAAELIAYAWDIGFITYLLTYHTLAMLAIIFLTFKYLGEPFYAPFVKLTTDGGETVMEKSTKILLVFAAILCTLVVAMALEPSRNFVLTALQQGVANPIYWAGVAFNDWLALYPALWILGSGLLGGIVLAIILNTLVRPRIHVTTPKIRTPSSSSLGPSLSSTPSGATLRPSIEEKVDIKEVVAKVKEELKEEPSSA